VAADSPVLLESVAEVFRNWRHRLGALLAEGGIPAHRAPAMSASLIAACEGAVLLSRAERSIEPFDLVAAERCLIDRPDGCACNRLGPRQ
jgi:TetR/AcrR family transcriptional regulator, lmrAB and yxaGH operons repressor